jgi:DNA mismatch endonuclease, patch repair protein
MTMDQLTRERRSWNMSRIRDKDTVPERAVRSLLHRLGYRFRLHLSNLPGKPDIVLPKYHIVVFVHGCFWHRHAKCRFAYTPKSNVEFWANKFAQNTERDRKNARRLRKTGWKVYVVWECQTLDSKALTLKLQKLFNR